MAYWLKACGVLFAVLCGGFFATGPVVAQEGGNPAPDSTVTVATCDGEAVSIARMQWPSAAILAYIHAQLIDQQLGCSTRVVSGDLSATASSMASTGQPLVAPEMWIGRVADIWNAALETQTVRPAGQTFSGGNMEGWFIPRAVSDAAPELQALADIDDNWLNFVGANNEKARLISCPPDWACALINRNLLAAYGLQDRFELVEPPNRFEMDRQIGEAMSRGEPILFYYWQPNAVLAQFDFKQLDGGAYNPDAMKCLAQRDCIDPRPSAFPPEPIVIALAESVFTDMPALVGYFQRASMPLPVMNELLAWQNEQGSTAEQTAIHFVESHEDIWREWVGQEPNGQ